MKRHDALLPLTHDHHHALAHARRLKLAAGSSPDDRLSEARGFLKFFADDTLRHFREEEELLFPMLVQDEAEPPPVLTQILAEHVRIHGFVHRLEREVAEGSVLSETVREIGELFQSHIRLEESTLFPLIERVVSDQALETLQFAERNRARGA